MIKALEGLRELKDTNGIKICQSVLQSDHVSVRRRALETLCYIDKNNLTGYLKQSLRDPEIQIQRTGFQISFRESSLFDISFLEPLAKMRENDSGFFKELLRYASQILGWKGIEYASLTSYATIETQNAVKDELHCFLSKWSKSQFYQAIGEEKFRTIQAWLNENELQKLGKLGSELRFLLITTEKRFK